MILKKYSKDLEKSSQKAVQVARNAIILFHQGAKGAKTTKGHTMTATATTTSNPFVITLPGDEPREYAQLGRAKAAADRFSLSRKIDVQVITLDGEGQPTVAFVASPVRDRHYRPFERIENVKFGAPAIDGWVPAYSRIKIKATVYRPTEKGAGWLVHSGLNGKITIVRNTKAACKLTSAMKTQELVGAPLAAIRRLSAAWLAEKAR